jgi:hypothetical protein
MNTAVLIASRELRDRSRLFLVAAAMAIIPFAAALAVQQNKKLAIITVAGFLAEAYTGALAIALGVSVVGRDLSEKRLSFLFSKPISAASIWIGKVAAAIVTCLATFAIILLPTVLFAGDAWRDNWMVGGRLIVASTLMGSFVLFFFSHAATTMVRSRSALIAVDFALLAVMLMVLFATTRPILIGGGLDIVWKMLALVGAAILALLIVTPIWQLSRGRIDARRNHATFSTVFWSGAAVVVLAAAAYAIWVVSAPLSSINRFYAIEQSPSGQWVSLSGQTENRGSYVTAFLVDTRTGAHHRVPVSIWNTTEISRDGSTAVWMESDELLPRTGIARVHTRRFGAAEEKTATPLVLPMARDTQLSDDGSRIAVANGDKLEVYEVRTGRLLGAASGVNANEVRTLFFAGPNVVRVLQVPHNTTNAGMRLREFDLTTRKLTTSEERPVPRNYLTLVTRDGSRLYLRSSAEILDAKTGNVLVTLPVKPERPVFGSMLEDGTSIVTRDGKLHYFDANGVALAEIAIPMKEAIVVGQIGASKVLLSIGGQEAQWQVAIVDLAAKKVDVSVPKVRASVSWWGDPIVAKFTEDASIVAMDTKGKPLLIDVKTGAKRPIPM